MRFQITFLILIFAIFLTGCPSAETPNSNFNAANSANAPKTNSELVPTTKEEAPTENNAPTLTPIVHGYYDALKKKNDAALKKVLAADFIKALEADMKADKKSGSLAAYVAESEIMPDKPIEVRNEKIEGDKASAELKGGAYLTWQKFNFIMEDGVWKMTNKFDAIESVTKSASNSNAAK